ncbi:DUF3298 domain-containing protein [Clostridium sp. UBA1056]|uniref:DUF3298 and DUF4163 domain-containing protein n=1 Tax=unclassified Clostridium TaxID=2614128 RepID=UPI003217A301
MFIRNPYDINSQYFYSDEYLDAEEDYKEYCYERMIPPFFPSTPGGPVPSIPPMPQPSQPSMPQPSQPPRPQPGQPPRPQPSQPPGPSSQPPGPPPSMTPKKPVSGGIQPAAVSPGSLRPCRFQFVYLWLTNGQSFWAWLTNVDSRTASGFRWDGRRWVRFGVNLNRIEFFQCFGRRYTPPETNVVINLQTQVLSPAQFKLEYPFIENAGNMANQEIIDALNSLWLNEVLLPEKINFIIVESAYEVPLNSNGLLSIVMSLYTKTQDNPSGNIVFNSLTVDVNTGKVYDLGDLFNTRMNYAKILSDIAMKKANEMNVNFIEPYNGITDTQQFYLTPEALVLYYQVGEYTPASMGLFRITIPYNEISNILSPESPIVRLMGTRSV